MSKNNSVIRDAASFASEGLGNSISTWLGLSLGLIVIVVSALSVIFYLGFSFHPLFIVLGMLSLLYFTYAPGVIILQNTLDVYDEKPLRWFSKMVISFSMFCTAFLVHWIAFLGLYLFLFPGLYLSSRLCFATLVAIDTGCSARNAIKKSWSLTKEYTLEFMGLSVACFFTTLLGTLFFIVGGLLATVFFNLMYVYLYRTLSKK